MPTYDYQCDRCGVTFEIFQEITDRPKRKCPQCGGRIRRLIGAGAGLLFKGSGFYTTDYRSVGYKKAARAEGGSGAPAGKGGGDGSSSKPSPAKPGVSEK